MADNQDTTSQDAGNEEEVVTTTGNEDTADVIFDKKEEKKEEKTEEKVEEKKEEKVEEKKEEKKEEKTEEKSEEKYDIKLPEGSLLDAGAIERTVAFAKEQGLTTKHAQALLDRESNLLKTYAETQQSSFKEVADGWAEEVKTDKEIGGEAFTENVELAKRVVSRYGSEDLRKGLDATGFGNHPDLVRMFVKIGKAMTEDQLVMPGKSTAAKKDMADVFYGQTQQ